VICGAVVLSVLCSSASLSTSASYGLEKWVICANEVQSLELFAKYTKLDSPAEGATVQVGSPVTFVGESGGGYPLSFEVASSPSALASPDIDSGLGSRLPATGTPSSQFAFTSTKAAATPRTIYWAVSFSVSMPECPKPVYTYTTPARALTVVPEQSTPPAAPTTPATPATPSTVSRAQIAEFLVRDLRPSGAGAGIGALLKGGIAIPFRALEPGTATIAWYYLPPGARIAKRARPVLVASGRLTFLATGTTAINVKPTTEGRRLLKHAGRFKLTAKGTFTPIGATPISAKRTFVLKK
jgi:hypothetical protein